MKSHYNFEEASDTTRMNRKARHDMYKRLKPTIMRVVELEKQIKAGVDKEAAENEMTNIFEKLTMVEMFAIEDYVYKHNLLDNKN